MIIGELDSILESSKELCDDMDYSTEMMLAIMEDHVQMYVEDNELNIDSFEYVMDYLVRITDESK